MAVCLDPVPNHLDAAVLAGWREGVDCTLEAVEGARSLAGHAYLKSLVRKKAKAPSIAKLWAIMSPAKAEKAAQLVPNWNSIGSLFQTVAYRWHLGEDQPGYPRTP